MFKFFFVLQAAFQGEGVTAGRWMHGWPWPLEELPWPLAPRFHHWAVSKPHMSLLFLPLMLSRSQNCINLHISATHLLPFLFSIFHSLFYLFIYFIFLLLLLLHHVASWILVPPPGTEPTSAALGAWSLNHWTAREVLQASILFSYFLNTLKRAWNPTAVSPVGQGQTLYYWWEQWLAGAVTHFP